MFKETDQLGVDKERGEGLIPERTFRVKIE